MCGGQDCIIKWGEVDRWPTPGLKGSLRTEHLQRLGGWRGQSPDMTPTISSTVPSLVAPHASSETS